MEIECVDDVGLDDVEVDDTKTADNFVEGLKTLTPTVGQYFETIEEARNYYECYGRENGFWIRTRGSAKGRNRSNEVTKAHMSILHDKWSGKWKVTDFDEKHNHPLVTPCKRTKMPSNRKMPKAVKDLTEVFHSEKIEITKVPSIFGGEIIGFDSRDCYNHLRNVRHKKLDRGDAQSVLDYFKNKQAENPQFFYALQCDEDGRAVNFFWVDARSRMAYEYFGDVVTFDTTYRTNKYEMPFAPFTGVNHHYQSIQFGCALLQDETEVSFVWLFKTWLAAM
ncbi:hypothetical protein RHMOL_Rhmol09G0094800 [Rhododendron molle]|uniref:Uncharacterized protein n=1 Tax=Rhododendron molle TaxID=49168 RepID=A0ACC0MCQ9_RHOML|nr:hypothetical protein RHMOL_Rhmol09G0094800 [Rhododendron molle]